MVRQDTLASGPSIIPDRAAERSVGVRYMKLAEELKYEGGLIGLDGFKIRRGSQRAKLTLQPKS